ncbi:MAG: hypothetical protein RIS94_2467, partial [Pseudomonadota bacterium]
MSVIVDKLGLGWAIAFAFAPLVAQAQAAPDTAPAATAAPADPEAAAASYVIPLPDGLVMPKLDFTPTPADELDYDKYFYFHRDGTSFADAYADIKECDALASGSSIYMGGNDGAMAGVMAQYGVLAGGIGGALGSAMADAIFGSAERRKQRR